MAGRPELAKTSRDIQGTVENSKDQGLWHPSLVARASLQYRGGHDVIDKDAENPAKIKEVDPDVLLDDDGHLRRTGDSHPAVPLGTDYMHNGQPF